MVAHIRERGVAGVLDAYKRIQEDRALQLRWLVNAAQAARTPMDKGSSKGLRNYVRSLHRAIDGLVPWLKNAKLERLKRLKQQGKPDAAALEAAEQMVAKLGL